MSPVAINLFCSFIFMSSATEIHVQCGKVSAHFPLDPRAIDLDKPFPIQMNGKGGV